MIRLRFLIGDQRGASAAEFALVVPVLLIVLFGTIDVGRYAWNLSQAEKATQTGARWAVATDMIASGLYSYSFATSASVPQGTTVNATLFPGIVCQSSHGGFYENHLSNSCVNGSIWAAHRSVSGHS